MASHLSSGKINVGLLRELYRRELCDCIDRCKGVKTIVWDDALTGICGLFAEYSLLKEHQVDKMFPLKSGRLPSGNADSIVFFSRTKLSLMSCIADNIKLEGRTGRQIDYHLFFVPQKSLLCEQKLKELSVFDQLATVSVFRMELVPFDYDVLSMELDHSFKDCVLYQDRTSMFYVANSLIALQQLFGIIPTIHGKGDCAAEVVSIMKRLRQELNESEYQQRPQIDSLVLIDRSVDLLTPLLSQLTYEGLIDDIYGISCTTVKLPAHKFESASSDHGMTSDALAEPKKLILNSSDELFAEIRDCNFNAVAPVLSKKAKMISAQFDERHSAKTVGEMKQFVAKLPHLQTAKSSLSTHTSVAELLKEVASSEQFMDTLSAEQEFLSGLNTGAAHPYIEDCIGRQEPLVKVLRLICVQCYCNNGFKSKVLEYYKREVVQTYGYEHLVTLHNLEKAGLLKVQGSRLYTTLTKTMKLIVDDVNEQKPTDISYVYSGYAPLSTRLVQFLQHPGWRSINEVLNFLPGPVIEEAQHVPGLLKKSSSSQRAMTDPKVVLVFFLGGVTQAEIAAFRYLSQLDEGSTTYLIATTKLLNSSALINGLMENYSPKSSNPF